MGPQGGSRGNAWSDSRDQGSAGPAQEQHVPVRGFNAGEAKAALKRGMCARVLPVSKQSYG